MEGLRSAILTSEGQHVLPHKPLDDDNGHHDVSV